MKKTLLLTVAGLVSYFELTGQTLQSVTDVGNNTTNPIIIAPSVTATTANTIAPALLLNPEYLRTGPAKQVTNFNATNGKAGNYTGISPTNVTGNGSGLVINVTITSNLSTQVTVTNPGSGYTVGDRVTIPITSLGGTIAGTISTYIADVDNSNTFSYANAPLYLSPAIQGLGYTGAYTPVMSFNSRFRNNNSASPNNLSLGYYWETPTTPYWAFLSDTSYALGMSSAGVNINKLTATTANLVNLKDSLLTITNGNITLNGTCNNAFITQSNFYAAPSQQEGAAFLASPIFESGVVQTLTINNAGSGYTAGSYQDIPAIGGNGSGLLLSVTVAATGQIAAVSIGNNNGKEYNEGDNISIQLPGGTGFSASIQLRTGHNFSALTNTSTYVSKTGDLLYTVRSAPVVNLEPTANCSVYGYYYNPTLINLRGKNIAWENTTGDTYLCSTSGNVGIGTSTPREKLSVKGTVLAQKITVLIAPEYWPDYIFSRGYQLNTPEQTEAYIRKHNHLPEVPSAEQIAQNGLDTGNTQALLLKKIEELTLLILQRQKQLTAQSKRISELETEQ